ncbi:tetratricopeptide repeat protein [Shouchella tritolerans]|uniref:tetratricopeptide repeat protein n=1 Tax=Shouchella tritolerans TaxID=2979466 RepID=UPI0021E8BBA8|nr:tetratricopeptide repeat protein [Shouchella tritolerans]
MSGQLIVYRQDLFNAVKNSLDLEYNNKDDSLPSSVLDIKHKDLAVLNAALLEQNYELAYIISFKELRLNKALRFAHTSLYHRYLGVVAANLGYYDQAIMHFNDAIKSSSNSVEYYRNIYIKSICYIKRKDDPNFAIKNLEKALTEIKNSEERSNLKFEEGWITNGLCLGETIQALKLPNIEKEKEIEKVFKKKMEVYKIISKEVEYKYIYLKYNILANMAFLLEINKDYKNAIRFWERAFSPMLNSKSIDAEKTLSYRLGIIHIKIGDFEAAQNYLKRSLELSRIEKNSFDSIIILYGLAYNSLSKNNFSLSEKYIQEGLELSKKIGDCSNNKRFLSLKEYLKKEVKKEELSPEFPSIKLRSYVDFLDLTFKPQRDINKELIKNEG